MPVTSFIAVLAAVIASGALTALAIDRWGLMPVLPVLMLVGLAARWALSPVSPDDRRS